jgi:hypothetical protein
LAVDEWKVFVVWTKFTVHYGSVSYGNVCVSASYIESCSGCFFIYWHQTTEWEKLKCLICDCTVLLVMVDKDVLWIVSVIYTKLDVMLKKKKNYALQVSSDIRHNCVSKNLVTMILLVINEKYYLL